MPAHMSPSEKCHLEAERAVKDASAASSPGVRHRQSKPRFVQGARRLPTRMTVAYGRTRRVGNLRLKPSPFTHTRGDHAFMAGTLCRDARGLSSETGRAPKRLRVFAPKRVLTMPHRNSAEASRTCRPR